MLKDIRRAADLYEGFFKAASGRLYVPKFAFEILVAAVFFAVAVLPASVLRYVGAEVSARCNLSMIYYYRYLVSINREDFAFIYIGGYLIGVILISTITVFVIVITLLNIRKRNVDVSINVLIFGNILNIFFISLLLLYAGMGISYGYVGDENNLSSAQKLLNADSVQKNYVFRLMWTGLIFGGACTGIIRLFSTLPFAIIGRH